MPDAYGPQHVGATALALLPLMGAGNTIASGPYKENVCRGLKYLIASQDPATGLVLGDAGLMDHGTSYSHLIATMALCEAVHQGNQTSTVGGCPTPPCTIDTQALRTAAQKAADYVAVMQRGDGSWNYFWEYSNGDTNHLTWAVMALLNAKIAGLNVDQNVLTRALAYSGSAMRCCGVNDYGRTIGEYWYKVNAQSPGIHYTAFVGLVEVLMGTPTDHLKIQQFCNDPTLYPTYGNLYNNFHFTHLLKLVGGTPWNTWNTANQQILTQNQDASGHKDGSWSAATGYGRHTDTCLALLSMQQYFSRIQLGGTGTPVSGTGPQPLNATALVDYQSGNKATIRGRVWGGVGVPTVQWSFVSGPAGGNATFSPATSASTVATLSATGFTPYKLRLTATDGTPTTKTIDLNVFYSANTVQGRYVRIRLPASQSQYLSLADIQVFNTANQNIAPLGTATQSSTINSFNAALAVDNNPGSASQTELEAGAWWKLDLGATNSLKSITVVNRADCCGDWLSGATVEVLSESQSVSASKTIPVGATGASYPFTLP